MPSPLGHSFNYWYAPPLDGGHQFADQFLGRVQDLGKFTTVEHFWSYYCHMIRPSDLHLNSSYYVFRTGVSPLWEDPVNQSGGRLLARVPKALSSRCWENLILALIGEQLSSAISSGDDDSDGFICGIGVTTKKAHDVLSVWHGEGTRALSEKLREAAQRALALPVMIQWEYRKNSESIQGGGPNNQSSYTSPVQSPGKEYPVHHHGHHGGGGYHNHHQHSHQHHPHQSHHQYQHGSHQNPHNRQQTYS